MLEELEELSRGRLRPRVVDVDGDPELVRRHGLRVPVLELAGEELCHGRLDPRAVARLDALLHP
ncbi:MAG: glutaredoxin family protein [Chromatiales bacterium]|nr:glutaredoxin family protein [Chromatiales bacterium]